MTRVLITGATGFTGREVVRAALAAGMEVTALTRDASKVAAHPGLTVVGGNVTDAEVLRDVLPRHDAVIHCLGVGGTGEGKATTLLSAATGVLVPAMEQAGVGRLVAMSNVGAGSSSQQGPLAYRRLVRPVVMAVFLRWLRPIIDDKNRMEPIIMDSALDWTIARFPNIADRPARRKLRLSTGSAAVGLTIGNADAANFLIAAATAPSLIGAAVSVSN